MSPPAKPVSVAASGEIPVADFATAAALPMPSRRVVRASSFPLIALRNTFSDKTQEPGLRRARSDSLAADERTDVLRKDLRTMLREHLKTPLPSEQRNQQRELSL